MQKVSSAIGAVLLASAPGCLDDEAKLAASWTSMDGAPYAVTGMAFDSSGTPIVMGGNSTFGEYFLQRPRASDGLWVRAEGVPPGEFGDPVFRVGDTVYAIMGASLMRLDDEQTFAWSSLGNPTDLTPFAVTADELVYATDIVQVEPNEFRQVLVTWSAGQSEWTPVPGSENQEHFYAAIVEPQGRVTLSVATGFLRGDASGLAPLFSCDAPEYRYCDTQISRMVIDAAGDLSFLVCPYTVDQRAIFRLPTDASQPEQAAAVPSEFPFCKSLHGLPDGTVFLIAAEDNLISSEAVMYRLARGSSTLEKVATNLNGDYGHVVRDGSTLFRFGDAGFVTGVGHRPL